MLVNIFYDEEATDADVIDLPEALVKDLDEIQRCFFQWLFDKRTDHEYWIVKNGEKDLCAFDSEAFVRWINSEYSHEGTCKAKVAERHVQQINYSIPRLFF